MTARAFALLTAFMVLGAAVQAQTLQVGSPAPTLAVAHWLKGSPVTGFEKGKLYVVEFWATWCGPCIENIPHLTELAKKYEGKVAFAGISVWEDPEAKVDSYLPRVKAFVEKQGTKMQYSVGADGHQGAVAKAWLEAAGLEAIPATFVVDREGKIAWIGHPAKLDTVLGKVLDGTFDSKAEAVKQTREGSAGADFMKQVMPYMDLLMKEKWAECLVHIDKDIAADPKREKDVGILRFAVLANTNKRDAVAYLRKLMAGVYKDDGQRLMNLAWTLVDDKSFSENLDPKLTVRIAERAMSLLKHNDPEALAYDLSTLGYAYFQAGQIDKAIATQEKAAKLARQTQDFLPSGRQEILDRLETFKKKRR